jgi:Zn ribbon nucleic-acid-binding protein
MSGHSYGTDCWKCGSKDSMNISEDNRPPSMCGECLECGYTFWTTDGQMTLDEVNEQRECCELPPLTELKKAVCNE